MAKLVWRVKLVAELEPGVATETEVARFERDEVVSLADLGLRLEEAKRLTAAIQAQVVPAQVITIGERCRWCAACGQRLASEGHYRATFRGSVAKFGVGCKPPARWLRSAHITPQSRTARR